MSFFFLVSLSLSLVSPCPVGGAGRGGSQRGLTICPARGPTPPRRRRRGGGGGGGEGRNSDRGVRVQQVCQMKLSKGVSTQGKKKFGTTLGKLWTRIFKEWKTIILKKKNIQHRFGDIWPPPPPSSHAGGGKKE